MTVIGPYRQRFDPLVRLIPPHLEVLAPFEFPGEVEALLQHLADICEAHAPIKVTLISWDVLGNLPYLLRLPVMAGRLELMALYTHLLTGPLSHLADQGGGYEPHLVFGYLVSEKKLDEARAALKQFEPKFTFRADRLELWQQVEVGQVWQVRGQVGLKGTVAGRLRRPGKNI